ncbi:Putative vacuolar protein sorting-associated protein 13C [Durusdinium trenchii]|uniref:Vacuolar protein sorting-associated protein 13C n=1 Tax=Durusdinium trenchii TaxID=1381693 RepID=A0ABP0NTS2_9DINO
MLMSTEVLLDLEEDTRTGPALKLLNLDLKTTSLAVKVESATDHRGQSSADFRLDLGLGSANVSHQGKPFLRPKEVDMEIQQALVLRLENKVEPSQNLMESLIFAPLEIYMIPGLVASLLGFWPGPPEAPGTVESIGLKIWVT